MTTPRRRVLRTTSRAAAVAVAAGLVVAASPATADVPQGWPEPPEVSLLDGLAVYVFAPLALVVLIALLTLAPSLARGERIGNRSGGDEWFGGRRGGPEELESGTPTKELGGASGSW